MSYFLKINKETGKILAKYNIPYDSFDLQSREISEELVEIEETIYFEINDINNFIFNKNKSITNIAERPNEYCIFDWNTKQWVDDLEILKHQINSQRFILLQQSDWTDTVSAQTRLTNYDEWQTYRQALRDITKQEGYPLNVIWPTQPN